MAPVCFAITCVRIAGENAGEVKSVYDLLSSKPGGLELLKDPKLVTATAEVATKSSCCPTLVFQQQAFFASSTIKYSADSRRWTPSQGSARFWTRIFHIGSRLRAGSAKAVIQSCQGISLCVYIILSSTHDTPAW